ncbi:MAG: PQQ-binding-like beta-propeller repeat protein, partial [Planctomycetaceae bacterium]
LVMRGRLFVASGAESGSILALDPRTGRKLWSSLQDAAGYAPPLLLGKGAAPQLICWTPSHVRSLHPDTGVLNWSVPYPVTMGVAIATPVVHRGVLLVSGYWEGTRAIRLGQSPGQHELIWSENRFLRALMSQPVCRDGYAYLLDKRYGLTCLEIESGRKIWDDKNQMTPRGRNPHASIIQLRDSDRVLVLNSDGDLILARLTPQQYTELSRTRIIEETWAHPAFAQRFIFARSDSHIVCRDLLSGPSDR